MDTTHLPPDVREFTQFMNSAGVEHLLIGVRDGIEISVISLTDLKLNKKASGRTKDLGDLEALS